MNQDQIMSLVRTGFKIAGTVLVTVGLMTQGQADGLVSAFLDLGGAGLTAYGIIASLWHHAGA